MRSLKPALLNFLIALGLLALSVNVTMLVAEAVETNEKLDSAAFTPGQLVRHRLDGRPGIVLSLRAEDGAVLYRVRFAALTITVDVPLLGGEAPVDLASYAAVECVEWELTAYEEEEE